MLVASRQTYKEYVGTLLKGTVKLLTNNIKRLRYLMPSLPQSSWVRSVPKSLCQEAMIKQTKKKDQVRKLLNRFNIHTPAEPDMIYGRVLRYLSDSLVKSFSVIFERVMETKGSPE